MKKQTIFYFVHAHGKGHIATFNNLYPEISVYFDVVAITTNRRITKYLEQHYEIQVLELPPKYPKSYKIPEHTFTKAFEVTPYAVEPAERSEALAKALIRFRPQAFYCDGVPELAIMVRGMGVPVIYIHLPGHVMNDPTQVFAHELADHIVAHFPISLEQPDYQYTAKTFYSGYITQYTNHELSARKHSDIYEITILLGYDNYDEYVLKNITINENIRFTIVGNKRNYNLGENCKQLGQVNDISKAISGDVVISAAGQNTIAELLSLGKRLILLPEKRPYGEQAVHANVLANQNITLLAEDNLNAEEWQNLLEQARTFSPCYDNLVNISGPKEIAQKLKCWYA